MKSKPTSLILLSTQRLYFGSSDILMKTVFLELTPIAFFLPSLTALNHYEIITVHFSQDKQPLRLQSMLLLSNVSVSTHKTNTHICTDYWKRNELLQFFNFLAKEFAGEQRKSITT